MLNELKKFAVRAGKSMALLAGTVVFSCSLINTAQAIPFNQISAIYFFGDSLTDSGFYDRFYLEGTTPPGKAPTFTTYGGYTWSQYLARDIKGFTLPVYSTSSRTPDPADLITNNTTPLIGGPEPIVSATLTGIDYAAGGSTTNSTGNGFPFAPSLAMQVSHYLATAPQTLDPNAVYFIWSGANDLLILLNPTNLPTELQLLTAANTAAINIANQVATLSARGAKRIVVLSLPNIGITPAIGQLASTMPALPGMMKTVTFLFNSFLNQQLGKVIKQHGTKVLYFDVYDLLDNVLLAAQAGKPYIVGGESFTFTNYTTEACGFYGSPPQPIPAIVCPSTGTGYLFADDVHPTGMAHRLLSLAVEQAIVNWK